MKKVIDRCFIRISSYIDNQRGMTLAELLIALVLLSVVLSVGYSFYSYGEHSFSTGESQSIVQRNARLAADFITRETRYANELEILDDTDTIPISVSTNDKYIFVDSDGLIKKLDKKGKDDVLGAVAQGVECNLSFQRQGNILDFNSEATDGKRSFALNSQVEILNLAGAIAGKSSGVSIRYKTSPDAKALTLFNFKGLSPSVEGFINESMKTITLTVPQGTDVKEMVADFEYIGEKVLVGSVEQISGVTKNDFSHPVIYTVVAENGSSVNYIVNVVFTAPPQAYARIRVDNGDPTIIVPYETSTLIGGYDYFPNGSGEEGQSVYQWFSYSKSGETVTYTALTSESQSEAAKSFSPAGLAGQMVVFGVKPISKSGVEGQWIYSSPVVISSAATIQNPFWTRFVNDTYYLGLTPQQIKDQGLEGYQVEVKLRTDYDVLSTTNPDTKDLNLQVSAGDSKLVVNGGTHMSIDVSKYVSNLNSYTILVDAEVRKGSGYGILLNGYVDSSNKNRDYGYMFQFDPGADGFLIRKIVNGSHDPSKAYGISNGKYTISDIDNDTFQWSGWGARYTTEIKLQIQSNGDLVIRVQLIDQKGNRSNAMWFGHTGDYYTNGNKFTGSRMPKFFNQKGSFVGIRTWERGGSGYDVVFQEITLEEGFKSIHISNAEYISDTEVKVNFEDEKGLAAAVSSGDKSGIIIGGQSDLTQTINLPTYQDLILTLKNPASLQELMNGARGDFRTGSIWMRWLENVSIDNTFNYPVKKDSTKPKMENVQAESNTTLIVTFNENLDAYKAGDKYNYSLSGTAGVQGNPKSVTVNGKVVTISVDKMSGLTWGKTVIVTASGVTDRAGNLVDPDYNSRTYTKPLIGY